MIDFTSDETHLLLNPRMPADERARLETLAAAAPPLAAHVLIATSGTSGTLKLTLLAKEAILASAAAVNEHLGATRQDDWLCVLPTFHVGGLGIHARAFLSGAQVVTIEWDAVRFAALVRDRQLAFSALVPAQVSDLVRAGIDAPPSLRAIIVGGGAMTSALHAAARALRWPLLQSYGMTEFCSQIATATLASDALQLLSHVGVRSESDGRLAFRGSSALTGYLLFDEQNEPRFVDPKVDGWLVTEDVGDLDGRTLTVRGRRGEFIKIGGESVDLRRLDRIAAEVAEECGADAAVLAVSDERLGHVIQLAHAGGDGAQIRELFDARVLPFERARAVHAVSVIPRSPLGKLLRARLAEEITT